MVIYTADQKTATAPPVTTRRTTTQATTGNAGYKVKALLGFFCFVTQFGKYMFLLPLKAQVKNLTHKIFLKISHLDCQKATTDVSFSSWAYCTQSLYLATI